MHLEFSPEEREFRAVVRAWLAANVPRKPRPNDGIASREFDLAWQLKKHEAGWAGIDWPKEHGGAGLSAMQNLIWLEESGRAGAPPLGTLSVALSHAGPTLISFGLDEQKQFHLPKILKGEVVWCQGFSEPNAGSDLASLNARGLVQDDCIVVTGQKIWTSHAHLADYQELLVRTDTRAPRHAGITWIICDMKAPGITVRPIKTITGSHQFCHVFYDQVRIPITNVVGGLNNGRRVAMATLAIERAGAVADHMALEKDLDRLIELASENLDESGDPSLKCDRNLLSKLARLKARFAGLRALTYTAVSRVQNGVPGPESSLIALYYAELLQDTQRLAMELLPEECLEGDLNVQYWIYGYLKSFSSTIMGGTSEIRRNVIAQRILGLPR
jgi:alkylation response protein AidB-like acyl-CoA dehydrogenase